MMKKNYPLSLIAALVLSACGGGGDGGSSSGGVTPTPGTGTTTPPASVSMNGQAMDSDYLAGQNVCIDLDADKVCGLDDPQATTDSRGNFTFSLTESERAEATQAWAIVTAPPVSQPVDPDDEDVVSRPAARIQPATAMIGYFDGSQFIISPFTTQLVNATDPELRKTQYQSILAIRAKLGIARELNITLPEANARQLFGDYLAAGDEDSIALAREAGIKRQQLTESAELQAQLAALLVFADPDDPTEVAPASNPEGFTSVNVSIRNLWEHSNEFQNQQYVRLQEITYRKLEGAIETTLTKGTRWYVNEAGEYDPTLTLQHYTSRVRKDWDQMREQELTSWEWDYNQDGVASLKGELAGQGRFERKADGLYDRVNVRFYNEGDPASEGAPSRPGREFCEGFDIQAEFNQWVANPDVVFVDQCVGFVQKNVNTETLNADGNLVVKNVMTEWQRPSGASSWQVTHVNLDSAGSDTNFGFSETRTSVISAQGEVQQ